MSEPQEKKRKLGKDEKTHCVVEGCARDSFSDGLECKMHINTCSCGTRSLVGWGLCLEGYINLPKCKTRGCGRRLEGYCINSLDEGEDVESILAYCDECILKFCFFPGCDNKARPDTNSCALHYLYPVCVREGCSNCAEFEGLECGLHNLCRMCKTELGSTNSEICTSCYVYGEPM